MKISRLAVGMIFIALSLSGCATSGYRGPTTDHFDGKRFIQSESVNHGFMDWVKRTTSAKRGPWRKFTPAYPAPPPVARVGMGELRVTFVNHATLLIQMDGINILTDPIWAKRSVPIVGPRRHRPPGILFENLPPIDAVLISHDHHDHMDLETLRRLRDAHSPKIYCGLGNAKFLERKRIPNGHDLDWWDSVEIAPGVTLTAVPAHHKSGRIPPLGGNRTLWCGFVITGTSGSVYFAGDTGWGSHFAEIAERFPNVRLALLPIGGFKPEWYQRDQHIGPVDAVRVHKMLRALRTVPMHFGTFPNGHEAENESADLLRALTAEDPDTSGITILDHGQSLDVPRD